MHHSWNGATRAATFVGTKTFRFFSRQFDSKNWLMTFTFTNSQQSFVTFRLRALLLHKAICLCADTSTDWTKEHELSWTLRGPGDKMTKPIKEGQRRTEDYPTAEICRKLSVARSQFVSRSTAQTHKRDWGHLECLRFSFAFRCIFSQEHGCAVEQDLLILKKPTVRITTP